MKSNTRWKSPARHCILHCQYSKREIEIPKVWPTYH